MRRACKTDSDRRKALKKLFEKIEKSSKKRLTKKSECGMINKLSQGKRHLSEVTTKKIVKSLKKVPKNA